MSEYKENVPKIRFSGFTDAWEQRRLGDVLTEKRRPIKMEDDEEYQLVTVKRRNEGIVSRGYFKGKDILVKNYFEIRTGDYLISKRQVIHGANGIVPKSLDKSIVSNEYLVSIGNKNITTEYWTLISKQPNMYRQFFLSSYGVDIEKLVFDVEDWKKRTIMIPSLPEQEKITLFFQRLDNLITLHQRKLNNVKKLKAGLLQKIFPKDGEDFPEVRFPGFTDAWEQRRLGELAEFSKGSGYTKNDLTEGGSPIVLYGRLYTKYETVINDVDTFVEMKENSVVSEGNEVVVPASGETAEDISRASVIGKSGLILGGDLNIIKSNQEIEPIFLALTISNGTQQKEMSKCAQGKSVVHLHNSDLKQVNLLYPKLEEQQRIGKLFVEIDHLITIHQRKLKHLQEQKKALLQQMFV